MPGKGRYALIEVPEFSEGMSTSLRIGEEIGHECPFGDRCTFHDHTDGNRVTTTRGDKIEVIGGTYQLIVLGRGGEDRRAGFVVSEGEVNEQNITITGKSSPSLSTQISVVPGPRGTKKLVETSVKGETHTTYHGDVIEQYYGDRMESITGAESPPVLLGVQTENPVVVDRTWAERISSYTGSEALPVPSITNVIWARAMASRTHVTSIKDTTIADEQGSSTRVDGAITSATTAGAIEETTVVDGAIESETEAEQIVSVTRADVEDSTYGNSRSLQEGNSYTEVHGVETTINIGAVNEVVLGAMTDVTLGATVETTVGASLDVTVGAVADMSLTATVAVEAGPSLQLGPAQVRMFLGRMELALARKHVALFHLLG